MKQNEIKLIAVDLDGTLLNDQKKISQYSQNVFEQLAMRNKLLIIVTARNYLRTTQFLNEIHGNYAICNNGASIWRKDGVCVYANYIESQVCDRIMREIYNHYHNIDLEIIMNKKTVLVTSRQQVSCFIDELCSLQASMLQSALVWNICSNWLIFLQNVQLLLVMILMI